MHAGGVLEGERQRAKNTLDEVLPSGSEVRAKVMDLIYEIEKQRLYRGKGGEIMRGGVCHLINSLSQAKLDFTDVQLF